MRTGDVVAHGPSGETWVLAYLITFVRRFIVSSARRNNTVLRPLKALRR